MFGRNAAIDHAPPRSLFGDFAEPYSPESTQGSGRVLTLPLRGISIPRLPSSSHLMDDGFGGGGFADWQEFGLNKDSGDVLSALSFQWFLPSNEEVVPDDGVGGVVDAYSCDEFRMYDFKVRRCVRGRSHDWTECPYAHPGEKARRRDPRKFHYSGIACPDFRKGSCKRGDACEFAHGVFESWLHPARYRTQPCKDGTACQRRVCFFAHTPEQLRVLLPQSPASVSQSPTRHLGSGHSLGGNAYDGSPFRQALAAGLDLDATYLSANSSLNSSPTSTLAGLGAVSPTVLSPPTSPSVSPPLSPANMSVVVDPNVSRYACAFSPRRRTNVTSGMVATIRNLESSKPKTWMTSRTGTSSSDQFAHSPRDPPTLQPTFSSLPVTPTGWAPGRDILGGFGSSDSCGAGLLGIEDEYEPPLERVESGRDVRESTFAKSWNQNSLDRPETPDFGWISELVK